MAKPFRPQAAAAPKAAISDLLQRGLSLHQSGRPADAARLYEQVLRLDAAQPAANHLLGLVRLSEGRADDAVRLIARAVAANGKDPQYLGNLGVALNAAGRHRDAVETLDRAIRLKPDFAEAHSNRGMALRALRRLDEAAASHRQAIRLKPSEPGFHFNLGNVLADAGDPFAAEAAYREALRLRPNYPTATAALAEQLARTGRAAEAVRVLDAAIAKAPTDPGLHCGLGRARHLLGEVGQAAASYRHALSLRPTYGEAHCHLAQIVRHRAPDAEVDAMRRLANSPEVPIDDRVFAGFGLGKGLTDIGAHAEAIEAFDDANRLHRSRLQFSLDHALAELAADTSGFDALVNPGFDDAAPIFVVGLPRSGKSSVEAILDRHPDVAGVGELPTFGRLLRELRREKDGIDLSTIPANRFPALGKAYMDEVSRIIPAGRRSVDTMPPNFRQIGYIATALPNARIIHCSRSPAEHCVAIYEKHLTGFGYEYASELSELAAYHQAYRQQMEGWHQLFSGRILDFDLGMLTHDREAGVRKLLEFCGLAWDAACLRDSPSELQPNDWSPLEAQHNRDDHIAAWRKAHPELWD